MSRMVDSLEKGGFITRRPNEENRRCNSIELTEKGHRADETWRERCREMEELMLDGFSAEERERFAGYLSRAYRNLRGQKEGVFMTDLKRLLRYLGPYRRDMVIGACWW